MPDMITVIHPKTGKQVTLLRSIAERMVVWIAPGCPLTEDDVAWAAQHLNPDPIRELMAEYA